jgi:hypothetical protein
VRLPRIVGQGRALEMYGLCPCVIPSWPLGVVALSGKAVLEPVLEPALPGEASEARDSHFPVTSETVRKVRR